MKNEDDKSKTQQNEIGSTHEIPLRVAQNIIDIMNDAAELETTSAGKAEFLLRHLQQLLNRSTYSNITLMENLRRTPSPKILKRLSYATNPEYKPIFDDDVIQLGIDLSSPLFTLIIPQLLSRPRVPFVMVCTQDVTDQPWIEHVFGPTLSENGYEDGMASDGAVDDLFGSSVSISGAAGNEVAIVGVWSGDDNGTNSGSAYIYRNSGAIWVEEQKLLASDGAASDWFGQSVSISGNSGNEVAIVGAHLHDDNGLDSGSAYIYRRTGAIGARSRSSSLPTARRMICSAIRSRSVAPPEMSSPASERIRMMTTALTPAQRTSIAGAAQSGIRRPNSSPPIARWTTTSAGLSRSKTKSPLSGCLGTMTTSRRISTASLTRPGRRRPRFSPPMVRWATSSANQSRSTEPPEMKSLSLRRLVTTTMAQTLDRRTS